MLFELIGVFVVFGMSDFLFYVVVFDIDVLYVFVIDCLIGWFEVVDVNILIVYEYICCSVFELIVLVVDFVFFYYWVV